MAAGCDVDIHDTSESAGGPETEDVSESQTQSQAQTSVRRRAQSSIDLPGSLRVKSLLFWDGTPFWDFFAA